MNSVVCAFCGAVPGGQGPSAPVDASGPTAPAEPSDASGAPHGDPAVEVALSWTSAVENGRTRMFCPSCSREHLRAIEAKLDSEWW